MGTDAEFIIRRATPDDSDNVYPLANELAASFETSPTTFAERFSRLVSDPDSLLLVAAEEGSHQLIGYLLGFQHETFFANGPVGWIEELFIRADSRRRGIAAALMTEFEHWAWASGARLAALATRRAHAFYEAIGYEDSAVYFRKLAPE